MPIKFVKFNLATDRGGSWRTLRVPVWTYFIEAIQEIPRNSKGVSDRQISFKAMHQVICQFCFTHFAAIVNIPSSALRNRPQAAAASCTALAGSACQVTCHGGTCTHLFNKVCVISYIYCNWLQPLTASMSMMYWKGVYTWVSKSLLQGLVNDMHKNCSESGSGNTSRLSAYKSTAVQAIQSHCMHRMWSVHVLSSASCYLMAESCRSCKSTTIMMMLVSLKLQSV